MHVPKAACARLALASTKLWPREISGSCWHIATDQSGVHGGDFGLDSVEVVVGRSVLESPTFEAAVDSLAEVVGCCSRGGQGQGSMQ
eukprot:4719502-Pleurochrysis_carterae.AAC.2